MSTCFLLPNWGDPTCPQEHPGRINGTPASAPAYLKANVTLTAASVKFPVSVRRLSLSGCRVGLAIGSLPQIGDQGIQVGVGQRSRSKPRHLHEWPRTHRPWVAHQGPQPSV